VPWHRLPRLRAAAPEAYDTLHAHRSLPLLLLRFLFDQEFSLFDRLVRRERGKVRLDVEPHPDVELIEESGKR